MGYMQVYIVHWFRMGCDAINAYFTVHIWSQLYNFSVTIES